MLAMTESCCIFTSIPGRDNQIEFSVEFIVIFCHKIAGEKYIDGRIKEIRLTEVC